jgi:hypothetical protein
MAWGGRNFYNYRLSLQGQNLQKVKELVEHLFNSKASRLDDFNHTKLVAEEIKPIAKEHGELPNLFWARI